MGQIYSELDDRLMRFIGEQPMFFVATAPSLTADGAGGHVNVSPKGYRDTLAIIDPLTVAYLDLTGSGAETIAHVRQNGRITLMFCSFGRTPKILRIYGTGQVVLPGDPGWPELAIRFPAADNYGTDHHGTDPGGTDPGTDPVDADRTAPQGTAPQGTARGNQRAIVVVHAERIADSCGYAVPEMELKRERDLLTKWSERRSADDLAAYRVKYNTASIDGLPALD
ncbi:MAG: pyridoxamine 5'-phosphate oxidase family protein [Streptosporangiaceae bacterium]